MHGTLCAWALHGMDASECCRPNLLTLDACPLCTQTEEEKQAEIKAAEEQKQMMEMIRKAQEEQVRLVLSCWEVPVPVPAGLARLRADMCAACSTARWLSPS